MENKKEGPLEVRIILGVALFIFFMYLVISALRYSKNYAEKSKHVTSGSFISSCPISKGKHHSKKMSAVAMLCVIPSRRPRLMQDLDEIHLIPK